MPLPKYSEKEPHRSVVSILAGRRLVRLIVFLFAAVLLMPFVIAARCLVAGLAAWVQCILVVVASGRLELEQ